MSTPATIGAINLLTMAEKRRLYASIIPPELLERFHLNPFLTDREGRDLLRLDCPTGSSSAEVSLFHRPGFRDPILYGHITDTINGQLHILLYILNDPESPRYDVDQLPDGTATKFGTNIRNIEAEIAAMQAGLSPGQLREGLHLLKSAVAAFEKFVEEAGHTIYFAEPLYYHNAVIFERYGFTYQQGRRRMESYNRGFSPGGNLLPLLDSSTPFRHPEAANSIRLRSWAIHDGILGEPFTNVTMYKTIGKHSGVNTCPDISW
ncbi:MAG: hypothetical protein FJ010_05610 [Chloroflexi bacterium]|nr:hypothetical protein [Chloroflexota bacterium]